MCVVLPRRAVRGLFEFGARAFGMSMEWNFLAWLFMAVLSRISLIWMVLCVQCL